MTPLPPKGRKKGQTRRHPLPRAKNPHGEHILVKGGKITQQAHGSILTGGTVLFRGHTYGECWAQLRTLVELGEVPHETCTKALNAGFSIHPPPQSREPRGAW